MAKKVLLGLAAVAVVTAAYFTYTGWPKSQRGAEGTIEAAKHYRAEQIQSTDVVLQDPEVQNLMQSDFFHRLVTDKGFQKLVADGTLQKMDFDRMTLLSQALQRADFRDALARNDLQAAVQIAERNDLARQQFDRVQVTEALRNALDRAEFRDALAKNDLATAKVALERAEFARQELESNDKSPTSGCTEYRDSISVPY